MAQLLQSLEQVAARYDAIVFDQWGVLHNGAEPYPKAVDCLKALSQSGHRLAVLSNSGKRAAPNRDRIADMGFAPELFASVMTSGEALWQDFARGRMDAGPFYAIGRSAGDAASWAEGLSVAFAPLKDARAVLLMGLPDGSTLEDWSDDIREIAARGLPVYCSNPDRKSPRAGDVTVISPGALAYAIRDAGGAVTFYGKPHLPVFTALQADLGASKLLMVGDSLEHDIAGGSAAGWDTALVKGGLYAQAFSGGEDAAVLQDLTHAHAAPHPTFLIEDVR
ncbi:TIGR01459 family HAD-type hydrolase [Pacificoceanicola onchidii]|uniref:TIGR01459 family HAD-type hydrolase n=1 Tax=Pacificoceanicola onchidii TaxID=2562685 RepID=UPI0010A68A1C|nr:TIGR01459 family HAD-type hydrolase [Pacificoceanicola onchidii]